MKVLDDRIKTLTAEKEAVEAEAEATRNELHRREVELAEARTSLQQIDGLTKQNSELTEKIESQSTELHKAEIALTELRAENKRLTEKAESDKAELDKLQASFRAEFKSLAGEMMEENSKRFKETNRESMDVLLKPFKDNIVEFRERVEKIYASENTERGSLRQELKQLMELNRTITEQTNNLTTALRGNSKVQGDFGEMILQTILERSNLKRGIHYSVQENIKNEEGKNLRPDVILNLPEGKRIVIDSKVSLTAHVDMVEAESPEARDEALGRLILSVRNHIKELAEKSYQDLLEGASPDFVIMFIPGEAAFLEALNANPALWEEAYERKIII
ncbi:MAG: DNA recombination protein RmuC, partial [Tidjanibacter sp.]|nr:DNA recombination protein RmuC [Tidjanibacter sp.]